MGRNHVRSSLLSRSLFLKRDSRFMGAGRAWRECEEGGVEGKLLNLETIKDVSSALCLVCSHKSAVLGSIQGHDNTHYSHYLPEQPINSHGHDKVPSSELLRPICSLTVILSEWQVKVFKWKRRNRRWIDGMPSKERGEGQMDSQVTCLPVSSCKCDQYKRVCPDLE